MEQRTAGEEVDAQGGEKPRPQIHPKPDALGPAHLAAVTGQEEQPDHGEGAVARVLARRRQRCEDPQPDRPAATQPLPDAGREDGQPQGGPEHGAHVHIAHPGVVDDRIGEEHQRARDDAGLPVPEDRGRSAGNREERSSQQQVHPPRQERHRAERGLGIRQPVGVHRGGFVQAAGEEQEEDVGPHDERLDHVVEQRVLRVEVLGVGDDAVELRHGPERAELVRIPRVDAVGGSRVRQSRPDPGRVENECQRAQDQENPAVVCPNQRSQPGALRFAATACRRGPMRRRIARVTGSLRAIR